MGEGWELRAGSAHTGQGTAEGQDKTRLPGQDRTLGGTKRGIGVLSWIWGPG